ncbi:MAG: HET-C-related protein, partial [Chloroflexota bacterium]
LIFKLLNILAEGEFGRPLHQDEIGGYLPSEHMDNPLGGGSAEDPAATASDVAKSEATLSKDQKQAVAREHTPAYKDMIARAAKASGLPPYIERGKQHCKDMLARAIAEGDTDAGKMYLGNGLHGIEDYFSHSNFTEVALTLLAHDGNVTAWKLLGKAVDADDGFNAATAGGKDEQGRNGIITGTYGDESHSANQVMSMIEQLKSEVLTGALRLAFIKGSAIVSGQSDAASGKAALGTVGKGIGAGVGAVAEAGEGTVGGMERGYEQGHGFLGTVESTISGAAHGLLSGGEKGAETGGGIGEHAGGAIGHAVGKVGGEVGGGVEAAVVVALASPLFTAIQDAVILDLDEKLSANRARASAKGAPAGLPTHSQVAKDAPENRIFPASRALAVHADTEVGEVIAAEWKNPDKEAATRRVQAMVDMIVAHPSTNRAFWEPILLGVLAASEGK